MFACSMFSNNAFQGANKKSTDMIDIDMAFCIWWWSAGVLLLCVSFVFFHGGRLGDIGGGGWEPGCRVLTS